MTSSFPTYAAVFLGILILVRIARYKKSGELQGIYNIHTICIFNIIITTIADIELLYYALNHNAYFSFYGIKISPTCRTIVLLATALTLTVFCIVTSTKGFLLHKKLSGKDGPLNELTKIKQQQPIADAHKVRCPSCLKLTVDTAKFCHHCGYNRETQSLIARCPSCQNPIVDDAKFCHHCGYEIDMTDNN